MIASLKRLSVVVCTHRRPQGLADLLASLRPLIDGRGDRELIVVNDGTHGPAYDAVVAPYQHMMTYDPLPAPVGIAKARNRSAALAKGEFLVFTDDDCVVPDHWLDWLDARLRQWPELDVVAGTTRGRDVRQANFVGRVQSHYRLLPTASSDARGGQRFVTANLAVRRALFNTLGGFNTQPSFAVAGEDTELASRLTRHSARTCIDQNWHVDHLLARRLGPELRRFRRYGFANGLMALERGGPRSRQSTHEPTYRGLVERFLSHLRWTTELAASYPGNRVTRLASCVAAASIQTAYDLGVVAGANARRRRQMGPDGHE